MFREEEQRPMNAQFAVRVAVLSGIALVVFAVVFFRLWYLEVLSGDEYLAQSQSNQTREIPIQAQRGEILDANGRTLVGNRTALSLQVRPEQLPENIAARNEVLKNLADVVGMPYGKIKREIRQQSEILPANPVTLEADVNRDLIFYLQERKDMFPGITAGEVTVRKYPQGTLASHLFGYVREVTSEQLDEPQYEDLAPGDRIGADGLELQYDQVLRGRNGAVNVRVDALGDPRGRDLAEVKPKTGDNLVLSIDSKVQQAGEQALADGGLPGAFVAMDPSDGSIVAMGSGPNFDPSVFTPPVSSSQFDALNNDPAMPLFSRAIGGLYPTGSTFKPITATAALSEGVLGPDEIINDDGAFDLGDGNVLTNSDGQAYGAITVQQALRYSSNIFFYTVGARLETESNEGLQKWASDLGIGSATGVDLPGETQGLLPTPEWRNQLLKDELTDRPWSIGDNVNLAVGQGDLQTNPLQMAVAYSALANGGDIVRPHLASAATDPAGRTVEQFDPATRRSIDIPPEVRDVVLAGMHDAATAEGGTSVSLFGDFPVEVAGKTGTAQRPPNGLQSWYASMAPYPNPKLVVIATVENGGYGAESAAPIAKEIYEAYFKVSDKSSDDNAAVDATTEAAPGLAP